MIAEDGEGYWQFIHRIFPRTTILLDSLQHIIFDADIIDHQPLIFSLKDTIDTGDGLDESMLLQGLVNIHRIQARHIETSNPRRCT